MDEKLGVSLRPEKLSCVSCLFVLFFFIAAGSLLFPFRVWANDELQPENVVLDAERVSYDDETGRASAEGGAVLTYQGTTIRAERIDYDAATQKVKASPLPGEAVLLQAAGRTVQGDGLEYDLDSGEGILTGGRSEVPVGEGVLYVYGGGIQLLPYDLAVERGLIKNAKREDTPYIAIWDDVAATTCAMEHPHYRIETKRIVFVPGKRVVAKRPRLYLGNKYIFTYPMDYIVHVDRRALEYSITPYIQNSEHKGTGFGFSGALAWDSGTLALGLAYWSDVDFEWMAEIEQSIGNGFTIGGGVEYSWDRAWDEKIYHPYASLSYRRDGWHAAIRWSQDEYIEDQKDSLYEYRGRLDRKPEFTVTTPWWKDPSLQFSWLRAGLSWGNYQERTPDVTNDTITRYGAQLQSYVEVPFGKNAEFFWNVGYKAWFYDKNDADQEIVEGMWGFRYKLGFLELASGYERRYVWGESPMLWDSYREAEKVHQKIRFPLGRELFVMVRGSYDLNESMVDEVNYALQWINDCMKWELLYRDDRTSGSEDKINLSVSILAYPDTPASFGEYKDTDPFDRPDDLPAK